LITDHLAGDRAV